MNITEIVFSPTGGTQRAADIVAKALNGDVNKVDLCDAKKDFAAVTLSKGDTAVIAVPSFGGRVPPLAAERLLKINGSGVKAVIICVYGNRAYEDTLVELSDLAEKCGFNVIAAIAAVAEHSIMPQYAAGRPDDADIDELHNFAKKIAAKLEADGKGGKTALKLPGNRPYKELGSMGLVPKANKSCNNCGLCAKTCPAEAISTDNIKTADKAKCISCMRCVKQCPQHARRLNGLLISIAALAMKKVCSQRKENELFI